MGPGRHAVHGEVGWNARKNHRLSFLLAEQLGMQYSGHSLARCAGGWHMYVEVCYAIRFLTTGSAACKKPQICVAAELRRNCCILM